MRQIRPHGPKAGQESRVLQGVLCCACEPTGERLQVIAVDYSENMLGEVIQRCGLMLGKEVELTRCCRKNEENCPDFDIIRADVAVSVVIVSRLTSVTWSPVSPLHGRILGCNPQW